MEKTKTTEEEKSPFWGFVVIVIVIIVMLLGGMCSNKSTQEQKDRKTLQYILDVEKMEHNTRDSRFWNFIKKAEGR